MLGLAVPASADYNYYGHQFNPDNSVRPFSQVAQGNTQESMSTAKYYNMSNSNLFLIAYYLYRNFDGYSIRNYLYDQSNDASFFPVQYLAYALHGLKGSITSSGNIIASNDLGSDSKDYFLTRWANMNSNATITDANRWRVQTLSDNSQYSWLYQVASGAGSMQLLTDALMNWSNPSFGMYSPADTANYSWFNQVLDAVNNSKVDVSGLAKQATLYSFFNLFNSVYTLPNYVSLNPGEFSTGYYGAVNFADGLIKLLQGNNTGLIAINDNIRNLDNFLRTPNDLALLKTTDNKKAYVNDFVYTRDDSYYQSFEIGSMIQDTLSPDLSAGDATNALGELLQGTNDDYWGWFSFATDSDLHPAASGVSTLSLDDEPSSQDIADSETVWVINPFASSSDLVSDFFGGE